MFVCYQSIKRSIDLLKKKMLPNCIISRVDIQIYKYQLKQYQWSTIFVCLVYSSLIYSLFLVFSFFLVELPNYSIIHLLLSNENLYT